VAPPIRETSPSGETVPVPRSVNPVRTVLVGCKTGRSYSAWPAATFSVKSVCSRARVCPGIASHLMNPM
jgi:hypothetical protein